MLTFEEMVELELSPPPLEISGPVSILWEPCVYFMQYKDDGLIKIGYSASLASRRYGVARQYLGHALFAKDLTVLGSIPGSIFLERQFHEEFDKYRVVGEWFEPVDEIKACPIARLDEKVAFK